MHTILVIGGYGFFGHRICAALARSPSIRLLVGGRDGVRAARTAQSLGLSTSQGVRVDASDQHLARRIAELQVDSLIHTAGPFQLQEYSVARAAIEAGCHYIDLADGRQFVTGIVSLDQSARARRVSVISGASSVPALSAAVVDRYLPRFERLESIQLGISSGARAPGLATVKGVFSYAGKPFRYWREGAWAAAHGWLNLQRHEFPSPLGRRWLGSCDIPDLELFPARYPHVRTVTFHAGFASDLGHLVVWALAAMVRAGLLSSMTGFAAPLNRLSRWMEPLISDQGGMFVRLKGIGLDRQPLCITWSLLAGQNHGPHIPCGAAIALAQRIAAGVRFPAGAMPCMGLLSVDEYLGSLSDLDIQERVE